MAVGPPAGSSGGTAVAITASFGAVGLRADDDIIASQKFHPSILNTCSNSQAEAPPGQNPQCQAAVVNRLRLAQGLLKTMDDARLAALVYPTSNYPPRLIGDLNTPHGNNSPRLSPFTGFPALTVPMGYARDVLPVGLQILGRPWSEPTLFKIVQLRADNSAPSSAGEHAAAAVSFLGTPANHRGKYLQLQFTVEDEGVFTTPWTATMTYGSGGNDPTTWLEQACAENILWYPGKEADVPRADNPDF